MRKRQVAISIPVAQDQRALWVAIESGRGFTVRFWNSAGELRTRASIGLDELNNVIMEARRMGYQISDLMI